jgi:translation initiation factor IF-3
MGKAGTRAQDADQREIWLFDQQGADRGFVTLAAARELARVAGLALTGPEGGSSPPRYRLEDAAREGAQARAARLARSATAPPKEIRLRVATGAADLETRRRSAQALLEGGYRVKIRVELDPARRSDPAPARAILDGLVRALAVAGAPDGRPFNEKGAVAVVLAPRG